MHPPTTVNRRTKSKAKIVALAVAMALVLSACYTTEQNTVAQHVNNSRAAAGLPPLGQNYELSVKAQAWAEHLADIGRLEHSNLPDGITYQWRALGENVGYGSNIGSVHSAYMNSAGHRANILSTSYNFIGTGYAKSGNRAYTVHVFMKYP